MASLSVSCQQGGDGYEFQHVSPSVEPRELLRNRAISRTVAQTTSVNPDPNPCSHLNNSTSATGVLGENYVTPGE